MGPAFRYDSPEEGRYRQFYQAGVELIGADHRVAADAEILALALEAIERGGVKALSIVTGDIAILFAFIAGLAVDEVTKARLRRIASRKDATQRLMKAAADRVRPAPEAAPDELATLLASIGTDKAEKLLSEIYALVGPAPCRRASTPEEIVERLVTRTRACDLRGHLARIAGRHRDAAGDPRRARCGPRRSRGALPGARRAARGRCARRLPRKAGASQGLSGAAPMR
ncbi:MAG: ATP phosphoribosyltransferase regulatory subunit [Rhizomicrobium sp.]